jgi:hypothetical protein
MMLRFLIAFVILLLPAAPAFAQQALQGSWAFQVEDAVIFRFDIEKSADGEWTGIWTRPGSFRSNGVIFTRMSGSEEVRSMAGLEFAGQVELSFDDPRPGAIPDIFRLELTGDNTARLDYVGTDLPPYPLIRVDETTPLGPFDEKRAYHRRNALEKPAADDAASDDEEPQTDDAPQEDKRPASSLGDDFLNGL